MEKQKNTINNDIKCSDVKQDNANNTTSINAKHPDVKQDNAKNKNKPKENKLKTNKSKEYYHSLKGKAEAYDRIVKAKTAQELYDLLPKDEMVIMYNANLRDIIKNNLSDFAYNVKKLDNSIESTIQGYFKLTNRIEKIRLEFIGMHLAILVVLSIIFASILIIK